MHPSDAYRARHGRCLPEGELSRLPYGPTVKEREAHTVRVVAEVTGADGRLMRGMVETVDSYTYTPLAAVEAARRSSGFLAPVTVFGACFAAALLQRKGRQSVRGMVPEWATAQPDGTKKKDVQTTT